MKACFMGLGYIGLPTAIIAAEHGIEVIGAVGALLGPDDGHLEDVADDLFQGLAVFFIHRQHEEGQHDQHHAKGRRAAADMALEQKEKRYADERAAAEAQNLPFC